MRFWLIPVLCLALLCGCTNSSTSTSSEPTGADGSDKKLRIAFVPKGATHEFWKAMQAGAEKAAAENNVELLWKAPLKEDDRTEQIKVVENFTQEKVDGLILAPLDQEALRSPVMDAIDAKIPVIIVDSGLKDTKTVSFIATDNRQAGRDGGTALAKALGGKGQVVMLRYIEGSASTMEREEGFLEAAKAGGLTVVSDEQYAGATRETAQSASENLLARFKAGDGLSVQGIFCPNESSAFGMMRALQNAKLAGKVKLVGFDSSDELLQAVKDGEIEALVLQDPSKMGYEAVIKMLAHLKGETVEERIDTGAKLVTKANIDSDEIKALLKK